MKRDLIREKALWMRRRAFAMVHKAQLGHPGGDFSATDIVATLLSGVLRFDPADPRAPWRDRFILAKGHATGALHTGLCAAGFFPAKWLDSYMGPQSMLNGHPDRNYLPGVETNTGPLGHGLPGAVGIAIAGQMSGADYRTFVVTGDGELPEGSNWESAMAAGLCWRSWLPRWARANARCASSPTRSRASVIHGRGRGLASWRAGRYPVCRCDGGAGLMAEVAKTAGLYDCREAFVRRLERLAAADDRIVAVVNDSVGSANLGGFHKKFPDRLTNVGIAGQLVVGVGAGLPMAGKYPLPLPRRAV